MCPTCMLRTTCVLPAEFFPHLHKCNLLFRHCLLECTIPLLHLSMLLGGKREGGRRGRGGDGEEEGGKSGGGGGEEEGGRSIV